MTRLKLKAQACVPEQISWVPLASKGCNCCHLSRESFARLWELEESFPLEGNKMMGAPVSNFRKESEAGCVVSELVTPSQG